jgi:DNA modification methylase
MAYSISPRIEKSAQKEMKMYFAADQIWDKMRARSETEHAQRSRDEVPVGSSLRREEWPSGP